MGVPDFGSSPGSGHGRRCTGQQFKIALMPCLDSWVSETACSAVGSAEMYPALPLREIENVLAGPGCKAFSDRVAPGGAVVVVENVCQTGRPPGSYAP